MLFEAATGIVLPLEGQLFEKLRNEQWPYYLDKELFGDNFADFLLKGEELKGGTIKLSRRLWLAIYDLMHANPSDRLSIEEWRHKYAAELQLEERQNVYDSIIALRTELFTVSESQLENRCIVLSKKFLYQRAKRLRKGYWYRRKRSKSHITLTELKREIPDLETFVRKGGAYFSSKMNRSDIIKQSLRSTVTYLSDEK